MIDTRPGINDELGNAVKAGKLALVRQLLQDGARPDAGEWPALKEAISRGRSGILACLLEAVPSQECRNDALRFAAVCMLPDMVQQLLDSGAEIAFDPQTVLAGNGAQAEMRRMLVAHQMTLKLGAAMSGDPNGSRASSGGPSPL